MTTALFFDAAGTLIDTVDPVAAVYARVFSRHQCPVPLDTLSSRFPEAFRAADDPDFAGLPDGDQAERAWWRGIVETCAGGPIPDSAFDELFDHYAEASAWTILPGVVEALEDARSVGLRLAVVSNFDVRLHRVLEGLGLKEHFEFVLTSGDARCRKPSPDIFRQALERMGVPPEQVRHVGDSARCDGEGARNAGIRPFVLSHPERDLQRFLEEVRHELPK